MNLCSDTKRVEGAKWFTYCPGVIKKDEKSEKTKYVLNMDIKDKCGGYNMFYPWGEV